MIPHPSRACDVWQDHACRCPECMDPEQEIDFWRECYQGEHGSPAECPTWYDWCNCGGTMDATITYLKQKLREQKETT